MKIREGNNLLKKNLQSNVNIEPELQQITFLDRRVYKRSEGVYYPSVTSILEYMPKNRFFDNWLKDVGHNADLILAKAGKEGTQVHEAAEALVKGEEVTWIDNYGNAKYSEIVWEMIVRFYEFWTTHKPKLILSEEFAFSDKYKYAGTTDLVVEMDKETWLLDVKTANSLHRAYDLQLGAYAKAIEETKGIKIDRTGIVWLKASTRGPSNKEGVYQGKGWQIKVVDEIDYNFDLFQTIHKLYLMENPKVEPIYKQYPITLKL